MINNNHENLLQMLDAKKYCQKSCNWITNILQMQKKIYVLILRYMYFVKIEINYWQKSLNCLSCYFKRTQLYCNQVSLNLMLLQVLLHMMMFECAITQKNIILRFNICISLINV